MPEEEEEEVIRCICGIYKDEGLMIQCEKCYVSTATWSQQNSNFISTLVVQNSVSVHCIQVCNLNINVTQNMLKHIIYGYTTTTEHFRKYKNLEPYHSSTIIIHIINQSDTHII